MILIQNKLRLFGFVFAFLFFTTFLLGYLYGRRPIPGAIRYSDNHFDTNIVKLKAKVPYKFVCDFQDGVFFVNHKPYLFRDFMGYNLPFEFSVVSDADCVWEFRHTDEMMKFFAFFWVRNFTVYENKISDFNIYISNDHAYFYFGNNIIKVINNLSHPIKPNKKMRKKK
ncbi:MAG: hypothetical protein ACYDA4_15275 [Ignavibacteriaceae bacterium]